MVSWLYSPFPVNSKGLRKSKFKISDDRNWHRKKGEPGKFSNIFVFLSQVQKMRDRSTSISTSLRKYRLVEGAYLWAFPCFLGWPFPGNYFSPLCIFNHITSFLEWVQFLFPMANPYLKIFIPTKIFKKIIKELWKEKIGEWRLTQAILFIINKASEFSNRKNERPWEFWTKSMLIAILFLTTAEYRRVPWRENKNGMTLSTYVFF